MGTIRLTRIPTQSDFQILDLFIDANSQADYRDLSSLQLPPGVDWTQGILLNGKAPVWLYSWALQQCRAAPWLAVMDPRHGGIVVHSGETGPDIASLIPTEEVERHLPRRAPAVPAGQSPGAAVRKTIAFVGPPHSGKSVLVHALHEALRRTLPAEEFQRDVFLLRACPDGEGNWFGEIPPERAAILRTKSHWDDDFVVRITGQIEALAATKRLVLVDCGGRIDRRMQRVLACCDAAMIVSHSAEATAEWRGALLASGAELLAEVESVRSEAREIVSRAPLRLRLGPFERGTAVRDLPVELLQAIAGSR